MKLYDYQETYLKQLPASCIMAADLGTGKTLMSLAHWERQQERRLPYPNRPLLIVAPASKIRTGDWETEAERWFGDNMPDITYISYESLRLTDKATKQPRWWKFTGARNGGRIYDVIADECHNIKNPQAKQSKAIYEIKQSGGLFIGLSGTPMPNGWIDFAGYSKLFGFTKGITEFKNVYCNYVDYKGFPELKSYNHIATMEKQFKEIAFKLDRNLAAELPSRKMIGVHINLTPTASKLYHGMRQTKKDPRTEELLDNSSRLLSVLRQSTTISRIDNLLSIVNDTSDNIVVYYNYISEREVILETLAKTGKTILRQDGERHDVLPVTWPPGSDLKDTVLVAHYKSASTGLNLQWANVTVYFSPTYSYQEFEQSIGRTHRNGQTKKCLYYLFSVKSTIDKTIWECLRDKRDFNDKLWKDEE